MEARNREADSKGLSEGGRAASRLTSGQRRSQSVMQGTQKDEQVLQGGEEFCWGHVGAPKGGAH